MKLIEEIKTYDDDEILPACRRPTQSDLQATRKKTGRFGSICYRGMYYTIISVTICYTGYH